jgi:hypothetical protein
MNRFEQLIEYVINDEEHKAQELFHDIIVEKSRQIYENMMADEEEIEEGMMGGDAADDLIDDVEMEEESDMHMEADDESDAEFDDAAEEDGEEVTRGIEDMRDAGGDEPASKDDIMNLEDKLDQLMAEFEDIMGGSDMGDGDGFDTDAGGDAIEMDDTSAMMDMGSDDEMGMMEAVTLKAAPKPVTSEEGGVNKKSTVAANAGAKGPIGNSVKPVHAGGEMGGHHDTPAYRNTTKDMIGRVGNTPAQSTQNLKPANKPHLGQASGVNTRSPVARG